MQNKSLNPKKVLQEVELRLCRDMSFTSGRILGSMCTSPNPLAQKVYKRYLEKNLGDPGLFPATVQMEEEVIQALGQLLHNPEASGNIVTGGTEANVLALWALKKSKAKNGGEIIVPTSAHCSFDKAASMLGYKIKRATLTREFQTDPSKVKEAITSKTVAIIGIAGTTSLGVVDPIDKLSELALDNSLHLHVDAAFGGFVLPFLKEAGFRAPEFDFQLPGVCSITIDPHKMGLAPIPAGGVLFRNQNLKEVVTWKIPYLSGGEADQATFVGTRSGASVVAVWALLRFMGREGYTETVKHCMDLTWKLAREIKGIEDLDIMIEPTTNVLGIKSTLNITRVAGELRKRGWAISLFPQHIRIVLMPHLREDHLESFLLDLRKIMQKLRG